MAATGRPELIDFEGISMVHYFTDDWENVQNFKARPDDILIATYPKAGMQSWAQNSMMKAQKSIMKAKHKNLCIFY